MICKLRLRLIHLIQEMIGSIKHHDNSMVYWYVISTVIFASEIISTIVKNKKCITMRMENGYANHDLISSHFAHGFISCFKQCTLTQDCETMNYDRSSGMCDLLKALPENCYEPLYVEGSVMYQIGDCNGTQVKVSVQMKIDVQVKVDIYSR